MRESNNRIESGVHTVLGNQKISSRDYEVPSKKASKLKFRFTRGHLALLLSALLGSTFVLFTTFAKSVEVQAISVVLTQPNEFTSISSNQQFDTWLKLPLGNRILLLAGEHSVTLTSPGYQEITQSLTIGAERNQQYELVMTREPGALEVLIDPSIETIATVSVDQATAQSLPSLVDNVAAGEREVTIDAPLYRPLSQSLVVQGKGQTQQLTVSLQEAWAEYTLSTEPAATILVNQIDMGSTPQTVKLEEGLREVVFVAEGYKPFKQSIAVAAQQDVTIPTIALTPSDGRLDLASTPSEAAVIVNGEYQGITPMTVDLAPNAAQTVQVFKAGYRLSEQQLVLQPDQREEKLITLEQDLVAVRLSVSPNDARVFVDGQERARGSQTLQLNTLPHQISVRKDGYVSFATEIVPTKRNQQLVSVKLLTKDQHYWASVPNSYTNKFGHQMTLFRPSEEFQMGSSRREQGRRANEVRFKARLTKPFYVSKLETTNRQFRVFRAAHTSGNYKRKSLDANKTPVVNISWQDAALYCNWLSEKEGLDPFYATRKGFVSGNNLQANGYRLLTEAEWSWLARIDAKTVLTYPWGSQASPPNGKPIDNFADETAQDLIAFSLQGYRDGFVGTAPVGRFAANHNGLYDMGGNVSEWVNDWYDAKGSKKVPSIGTLVDPIGPDIGEFHVVRGASWAKGHLPQLRLAYRDYAAKGKHDIGFRVARYAGRTKGGSDRSVLQGGN